MQELLEDDKIVKVGINPMKIGDYLSRNHNIRMKSTLDIRHMAKMTGSAVGYLKAMCETHLGHYYAEYKAPPSWAIEKFKDKELEFAARDSHQAMELFKIFHEKLIPNSSHDGLPTSTVSLVKEYLDVKYADQSEPKPSNFKYVRENRNRNWKK